jgi:methylglutaconyl-CoA hydratase
MNWITLTEMDHVAYVKLHRPDMRNAFNTEMIDEITRTFQDFEKRQDLRAVTLSGEGKAFCAGADLNWMKEMVNYSLEENRRDSLKLFAMFEAIANCSLPVLGLVHGGAFGGALGLIACCDHVIAEEGMQFCFSEVKLGIAPAVISSFVYKKCTPGHVRHLMMSGAVFGTQEAYAAGLIHVLTPQGQGHTALQALVKQYQQCGPEAVRSTKKLLNEISGLDWKGQKERTTRLIAERRVSAEGQEGLKAFLEKREPSWRKNV